MIRLPQFYTKFHLALIILWVETLILSSRAGVTHAVTTATTITTAAPVAAVTTTTKAATLAAVTTTPKAAAVATVTATTKAAAVATVTTTGQQKIATQAAALRSRLHLANGSSVFDGRVEILHNGQWGTICDDDADVKACVVICRHLGFKGGMCMNEDGGIGCEQGATIKFGQGQGPIWVDDLKCTGLESIIDECLKSNWGVSNCQHKEDLVCFCDPGSHGSAVRLVNGSSSNEGRVEIYHNRIWGSVCDDAASASACRVVCRQLNLKGGKCVNDDGRYGCESDSTSRFGLGEGKSWIDELACTGTENSIQDCHKNNWGAVSCVHKEDLSCICSNKSMTIPGQCDPSRHRLTPSDPSVLGIGRVEIQDPVTDEWGVVCDDSWNDVDATVFCLCLGYTEEMYFHSLFNQPPINDSLPLLYDAVDCLPIHVANRTSLFDCATEPATPGRCDAEYEAAYVACTAFPNITNPETPEPNVTCQGTMLNACFPLTSEMNGSHFNLHPLCSEAKVENMSDILCYHIDFTVCTSAISLSTNTTKPYCYDIMYSAFDMNPDTLITDHTWSTRVCCAIDRNSTAGASFRPVIDPSSHDKSVLLSLTDQRSIVNYTLECFTETNFSGVPIKLPAVVSRGTELFCKVKVNTWDRNLYLIVTSCRFLASLAPSEDNSTHHFVKDKCITPLGKNVGLRLHSIDNQNWGFRFQMPKFQGFDVLYLQCETSVCDKRRDPKPDCDRSCINRTRTSRHVTDDLLAASKGRRSADDQRIFKQSRYETDVGPFFVWGVGQDYIISEDGDVVVFQRTTTAVPGNLSSSSVNHRHYTSMTQSTLVHFFAVICLLLFD